MKKQQVLRRSRTAYLALALIAAGCTNHVLVARSTDSGVLGDGHSGPEAGPDTPALEVAAGPDMATDLPPERDGRDVAKDSGPDGDTGVETEVGQDTRPDMPADRGPDSDTAVGAEVGRDTGPDMAADLPPQTILDGGPSGCTVWPATAILADLKFAPLPSTLLVHADTVFVAFAAPGTDAVPPTNTIVAVTMSTGKTETFSLGSKVPNRLAAGGDGLFYVQGTTAPAGGGGWSFSYPDVAHLDLATGQVTVVDTAPLDLGYGIRSLVGNQHDEVFWSIVTDPSLATSVIRRWDEPTRSVETILEVEQWDGDFLVDQEHVYWFAYTSSTRMAFVAAPTTGGPVAVVKEWHGNPTEFPTLFAVDEQSLYFTLAGRTPPGIFAIPKGGGEVRTVAATAHPTVIGRQTVDDKHVYWSNNTDTNNIWRAPKAGDGDIEKLVTDSGHYLTDLAVDACSIYWIASDKNRLLVRSK